MRLRRADNPNALRLRVAGCSVAAAVDLPPAGVRHTEPAIFRTDPARTEPVRGEAVRPRQVLTEPARRELAVAPSYASASSSNGGGAGSKLLMLAAGVAVGKFILGGGGGKGGKKLAVGTLIEPGYVTRRKHYENKEYVLKFRPPKLVARAAEGVQRGYEKVKNRISEYIEK